VSIVGRCELATSAFRCVVQVRVGNRTYHIGELELAHQSSAGRFLLSSVPFTAVVAVVSGVLLTLVVVICVAYHHKSRESQRIVRRMQTQMNALEARVANECKEGSLHSLTLMASIRTKHSEGPTPSSSSPFLALLLSSFLSPPFLSYRVVFWSSFYSYNYSLVKPEQF